MTSIRGTASIIGLAILFTVTGCAKFPSAAPTSGKQLVLTLKVRGKINPIDAIDPSIHRHYFIAIDNDNNINTGPWAVVGPPYGNGWVTAQFADRSIGLTSFVQYDDRNTEGYIYSVRPGSYFLNVFALEPPIQAELLDDSTLRVIVDFSQIATAAIPADKIKQLDINFLTTNELPLSDVFVPGRIWDGLGSGGRDYVTVNTTTNGFYSDNNPSGPPVSDRDLDIVYWSVEVQAVSSR